MPDGATSLCARRDPAIFHSAILGNREYISSDNGHHSAGPKTRFSLFCLFEQAKSNQRARSSTKREFSLVSFVLPSFPRGKALSGPLKSNQPKPANTSPPRSPAARSSAAVRSY
jgi:hypothetical protein